MKKLDKAFIGNKLLVCGVTPKDKNHVRILYEDFTKLGIDLFFMYTTLKSNIGLKTYDNFADLPELPDCAYIMSDREQTATILRQVIDQGIKKILFFGPECFDEEGLALCEANGVDARFGCPLIFCEVIFCRIHAFFGGFR